MAKLTELKRVKNAVLFTDGTNKFVRVDDVRISFPALGTPEPETDDDGNPRMDPKTGKQKVRYKLAGMLPKATHLAAKDLIMEVVNELLKNNEVKIPNDKRFITNGNDSEREEYQDHWIVSAGESRRPPARDAKGELMLDAEAIDEMFFGGCRANILLRPWYYNGKSKGAKKDYPKRIACGLAGVQFNRKDDPFGSGRINEEDAWDQTSGNDDAADLDDDDGL